MQNFGETTKEYYGNFESGIILVHDIHVFTSNLQVISNEFWLVYRAVCPIWLVGVFTVVLIYRYSFDTTVILSVMELIAQSDKIRKLKVQMSTRNNRMVQLTSDSQNSSHTTKDRMWKLCMVESNLVPRVFRLPTRGSGRRNRSTTTCGKTKDPGSKVRKRNDITLFSHWNPRDLEALKFKCFSVLYRSE